MRPLFKNWSLLSVSDICSQGLAFLAMIKIARELRPEGYGSYNLILAVSAIFLILANFGMTQVIIREVARKPFLTGVIFVKSLCIRVAAGLLASASIWLYFRLSGADTSAALIAAAVLITIAMTGFDLAESIAFGRQAMQYSAAINMCGGIAWASGVWLLPRSYFTLDTIVYFYVAVLLAKNIAYYVVLCKKGYFGYSPAAETVSARSFLTMSLPYLWLWGIGIVGGQVPILFLAQNAGDAEVGLFSVGMRLVSPLSLVLLTVMKAIFPNLSQMWVRDEDKFRILVNQGGIFIVFFSTIMAFLLSEFSYWYVPMIFGKNYEASVGAFNCLLWFTVIYSLDLLIATALSASDRQNMLSMIATVDIVVALPLLYYGSTLGAFGLALSKLVCGIVILSYRWVVLRKLLSTTFSVSGWLIVFLYFFALLTVSEARLFHGHAIKLSLFSLMILISLCIPHSPFRANLGFVAARVREEVGWSRQCGGSGT